MSIVFLDSLFCALFPAFHLTSLLALSAVSLFSFIAAASMRMVLPTMQPAFFAKCIGHFRNIHMYFIETAFVQKNKSLEYLLGQRIFIIYAINKIYFKNKNFKIQIIFLVSKIKDIPGSMERRKSHRSDHCVINIVVIKMY